MNTIVKQNCETFFQFNAKVIVGMSGGVDSSVAAMLLKNSGYDVSGIFMKNWEETDPTFPCTAVQDARDALDVCDRLGISLEAVNFSSEYWNKVFELFLCEYQTGRTPNPDILCNKEIKFKCFLDYALNQGAEYIATGHYARILWKDGAYRLYTSVDTAKDQTYFLYTLGQSQLSRTIFPLGGMNKTDVRRLAREAGFDNASKKDSTGICFIGERNFHRFLSRYAPTKSGDIRTYQGDLVGSHMGLMYYTLGQRKGMRIGGRKGAAEMAWYVVDKNVHTNELIVAQGHDHPLLYSQGLIATNIHWTTGINPDKKFKCSAKTRYRQAHQQCSVEILEDDRLRVLFDHAQRAVTPGQSVVFYQGEECLGGAIIDAIQK